MCLLDYDYGSEYELKLSAWGGGILSESGLLPMQRPENILSQFKKSRKRYPRHISLLVEDPRATGNDYWFTGIDPALLEKLKTLKELILPDSIENIEMTPKLGEILHENNTLIRGSFGSFTERFAAENGLNFRPADFVIAEYFFEPAQESTQLTVVFKRNGSAEIKEKVSSPGTNAGNTFGGTFSHYLSSDFYLTKTAEQIAEDFSSYLRGAILEDGRLAAFIEKAKNHSFYTGKN